MTTKRFYAVLICLAPAGAWADTVALSAAQDNTLYSDNPGSSNGAGEHLFAGVTNGGFTRRGLIAFDIASAIPAGSQVTDVQLTLFLSRTQTNNVDVNLHRVLESWGEGTSDADGGEGSGTAATTGDATWSHRFWDAVNPDSGTPWATPGGAFDPVPRATLAVGNALGAYTWTSAELVADVQNWLDGVTTNSGWLLDAVTSGTRETKRFESRQAPDVATRPVLSVTFAPPPGTGACCPGDGSCLVSQELSCTDSGGSYQGDDTTCSPISPCPEPAGACCIPDAAASCLQDTSTGCLGQGGTPRGAGSACASGLCPVVLTPYLDPLPIPPVAQPTTGTAGGEATYRIAAVQISQQLHTELPLTTVWGYDDGANGGSFPGPTIEAVRSLPVDVTWVNDLRDATGQLRTDHVLPVDTCIHGADDGAPQTVVHLHGGHIQAEFDGYPEDMYPPGEQLTDHFPNWQQAATLWYHDHALGMTRLNVYMGLAGFYLIRDEVESSLDLPTGEYEIPLVIQDRTFNPDGSLAYPVQWQAHFFGDHILVNGKVWPFLEVDRGKYRFRVLNGSNSRSYRLHLSNGENFVQIGSDGGLLTAPVVLEHLVLSPGERADLVLDFEDYEVGTEIVLMNDAPAPYPGSDGVGVVPEVMKLIVTDELGHTAPLPTSLAEVTPLQESEAVESREFVLQKAPDPCTGKNMWVINGLHWDHITERPRLGTAEIWTFINPSGLTHPMHMHLVFFQVLDRQSFELVGGKPTPNGPRVPPPAPEAGWKDTIQVGPMERVRVIARFEDFVGKFAYHCHILEHEDHEMMRQFEASTTCGDGARGIPQEECDDGNLDLTDSCPDGETGSCTPAFCGDGFVWSTDGGTETCDDGNLDLSDSCPDGEAGSCVAASCGDGFVWNTDGGTETCDDGNLELSDSCPDGETGSCAAAFCGDGFVWSTDGGNETCDDGNNEDGDGCSFDCRIEETGGGDGGGGGMGGSGGRGGSGAGGGSPGDSPAAAGADGGSSGEDAEDSEDQGGCSCRGSSTADLSWVLAVMLLGLGRLDNQVSAVQLKN